MDRRTVWRFQEQDREWMQQGRVCELTGVSDSALGSGVYVITLGNEVLYVGQSSRGLLRTQEGFRLALSQSRAYKWRERPNLVGQPLVVSFYDSSRGDPFWEVEANREALEADVAAAVRFRAAHWPSALIRVDVQGGVPRYMGFITTLDFIMDDLTWRQLVPPPHYP